MSQEDYDTDLRNKVTLTSSEWERNLFDSDIIFKEDTPLISKDILILI
jgi:hypothetical protein